ncbi:MAG: endolytic transglycosylase MltG [Gammaproteobacteria bacterium]|nr:endolytic transglycosylase MltG [Gammaproteobacteria bacterium]NNC97363.1 endolytic transglycosylase MltG [Gammaproteobacteria bacterium]NNM13118.1 endolytic transglycosylase MltG [Gammaproteobacteria bacterium]
MGKLFGGLLLVVLLLSAGLYVWYQDALVSPLNIATSENYTLNIKKGDTLNAVARRLENDGIISNALLIRLHAKQQNQAHKIKAGQYVLDNKLNIPELLIKLVEGKVVLEQITIPEGLTFREMLALLHNNSNIIPSLKDKSDAEIMLAIGQADVTPEGQFLPETYRFAKGTEDRVILKQSFNAMQEVLKAAWENRNPDIEIKTPYEALILASIIEKETGVFDEQATIAGVFNSRLRIGMRLQTDPTVIYGMGDRYTGNIRKRDLQTDTPYNTYTRSGLPPTPIALPGKNAIMAALNPEQHKKLYFVATGDGDGRHYFSESLAEHQLAVQRYLRNYRKQNK